MRNQGSKAPASCSQAERNKRRDWREPEAGARRPLAGGRSDWQAASRQSHPIAAGPVRPFQTSLAVPRCCVPGSSYCCAWAWHPRSRSPASTAGGILSLHDAQHRRSGQSRQCNVQFWTRIMRHCVMDKCLIQFFFSFQNNFKKQTQDCFVHTLLILTLVPSGTSRWQAQIRHLDLVLGFLFIFVRTIKWSRLVAWSS